MYNYNTTQASHSQFAPREVCTYLAMMTCPWLISVSLNNIPAPVSCFSWLNTVPVDTFATTSHQKYLLKKVEGLGSAKICSAPKKKLALLMK